MKIFKIGSLILLISMMMSCATTLNYDAWLDAQSMPSQLDVTGKWNAGLSMAGGWGEANLIQKERNVYGTLGLYSIKGVVSKTSLFVKIFSGGHVYYTAKLDANKDGSLSGVAIKGAIVESPEASNADISIITMTKIK